MSKKLRPLSDNVLVKRLKSEAVTSGGIFLPESSQDKTQTGVVEAVGAGKILEDGSLRTPSIKPGDVVMFGKYSGNDIELDSQEYLIIKESDILGIIENN